MLAGFKQETYHPVTSSIHTDIYNIHYTSIGGKSMVYKVYIYATHTYYKAHLLRFYI